MKFFAFILVLSFSLFYSLSAQEDKFYKENGGELIFSFADLEFNDDPVSTPMRFTMFFHLGQKYHYNITRFLGLYSGYSLRNIGFISEMDDVKTKRRTYSFGIPLALKLGVLDNDIFIYGGASYELFFHYKQKQFIGGEKSKFTEWFSPRTERFGHSLFTGIRFPGGWDLKFKYYPGDFLNTDYEGEDFNQEVDYSNYTKSNLFYIGLSFNFRPDKIFSMPEPKAKEARFASLKE